ncbi:MAG: PAS domain S-box protein [Bacteroidales bacterium]
MSKDFTRPDLLEVRNQIINVSLTVTSITGSIAYLVSLYRWYLTGFQFSFIIEFLIIASLIALTIRKASLSLSLKTYVIISLIFLFSISDALRYGLFSAARVYLILIPFFSILVFSLRRTLVIYILTFLSFLLIGLLHYTKILSIPSAYEPAKYILRMYPWIINGIHISIVAVIIFLVTRKFMVTYSEFIQALNKSHNLIREREQNYREIFNSTNEAIFIQDAGTGKILDVNEVMVDMYKFSNKEEVLTCSIADLSKPDGEFTEHTIRQKIENTVNAGSQLFEWQSRKKDGEIFWTEVSMRNSEIGGEGRILAVVRDISRRKKTEEAIQQSQELFRKIIEMGPYAMIVLDRQNRFRIVNAAFTRDTGIRSEDAIGKTIQEIGLDYDPEGMKAISEQLERNGKVENVEARLQIRGKEPIDILYSSLLFSLNDEQLTLSASVNITERKLIEKELENHRNHLEKLVYERTDELDKAVQEISVTNEELSAANEELIATNEELYRQKEELKIALEQLKKTQEQLIQSEKLASLGILASGIAHEINNPLNFISVGVAGLEAYLTGKYAESIPDLGPYLNGINEGVRRAAAIVKSLGHYNRNTELPFEPCNIHEIIDNCLTLLHNEIKNKLEIRKDYTQKLAEVSGNEGKLHQAILNILANATQAIEQSGIIQISTRVERNFLRVEIKDNGSGIRKEIMPRVFDLFFTTKEPGKGSGMGLSITYDIIREHKGNIQIESEEGNGTSVILNLPLHDKR